MSGYTRLNPEYQPKGSYPYGGRAAWTTSVTAKGNNGLLLLNGRTLYGWWKPSGNLTVTKIGGGNDPQPSATWSDSAGGPVFTASSSFDMAWVGWN